MEEAKKEPEKWVTNVSDLAESYRDLITIKVIEHSSLGISVSIVGVLALLLILFVFLFAGLGTAWWLGEHLSDMKSGYFIVGGVYTLLFVILLASSRTLLIPRIRNILIKKIYEED
jgi:hypothetical protein